MERESKKMEANNNVCENVKKRFVGDDEEEDLENLKRRISSHPLYGLLIESHLNCLKVGLGGVGEVGTTSIGAHQVNLQAISPSSSEIDRFMETYCVTLSKLKQAIEEPGKEMESFIDAMYVQLKELCETETYHPNNPKPNSPAPQ